MTYKRRRWYQIKIHCRNRAEQSRLEHVLNLAREIMVRKYGRRGLRTYDIVYEALNFYITHNLDVVTG